MNNKDEDFIVELYARVLELEDFIRDEGFEDRVLSAIVIGVLEQPLDPGAETTNMRSLFSYNLATRDELETMKNIMDATYETSIDDDLNDMLGDLGISLN